MFIALLFQFVSQAQIANYVSNGSFEQYYSCTFPKGIYLAKGWRTIDSSLFSSTVFYSTCYPNVPYDGVSYQLPKTGTNFGGATFLCQPPQCSVESNRGYLRNRLKSTLQSGKTYCVKFFVNIRDNASYGIDGFGAYFGDNSIDTIAKPEVPLSYLNPQVQNPNGNIITDTMNWIPITGTFVASGNEKFLIIGNFKSDAATNKTFINPAILPTIGADVFIDDVSCIPLDLPAYAAPSTDVWAIPGSTVYLGRQKDVGIDEACEWFKLPDNMTVIANAAGITLTVTAAPTETYMVKQDICGVIKYDTVVVHGSNVGNVEWQMLNDQLQVFPNPASEMLSIQCSVLNDDEHLNMRIYNNLGQVIREEEVKFINRSTSLNVSDLPEGVYTLSVKTYKGFIINKRVVIAR